jgi:hypothetical protein
LAAEKESYKIVVEVKSFIILDTVINCAFVRHANGRNLRFCQAGQREKSALLSGMPTGEICAFVRHANGRNLRFCQACQQEKSALLSGMPTGEICAFVRHANGRNLRFCHFDDRRNLGTATDFSRWPA